MVLLIAGASHTGKTLLAQRLLERYRCPYLSIDHLKMGLIRSGRTALTAELWPILREMVKTAVENGQNLMVEGCYIPFDWKSSFEAQYLAHIRYVCLIMTERYIESHFGEIKTHADDVEHRLDDSGCTKEGLIADNTANLAQCRAHGCDYILIDGDYAVDITL